MRLTRGECARQTGGMVSHIALLAALFFVDRPVAAPEFVEPTIRDGISLEDRQAVESILKQRRETFDRITAEIEQIQEVLPRIRSGKVELGVDRGRKPAPDSAGEWHFADPGMKAATINAYHTRLRILKQRLRSYAADPTFTIPFAGQFQAGTIGYLPPLRVIHVMTEVEILADGGPAGPLWIQGIDAREIADNQALLLPWAFYVDGPRHYVDDLGARRTVLLLRRFDVGRFLE